MFDIKMLENILSCFGRVSEEWLGNGDLKVVVNVPAGLQMEFYDKINAATQGSVLSEEVKEAKE